MQGEPIVRAFDGSLADAEGLLGVEKATFDESPYTARQVQAMLGGSAQRAWLAVGGDRVIGFVVAFSTHGLRGVCWEIDLLAVHPDWTRRGLATRLLRAAVAHGASVAGRSRAVVSTENFGSGRAFARAGFQRTERCELLIFRPEDGIPRPWHALGVTIREAGTIQDVERCLQQGFAPPGAGDADSAQGQPGWTLLMAESHDQIAGCAELSEVQTLLYHGVWIESLVAPKQMVRIALAHRALSHAAAAGLDEIGIMVPTSDYTLRVAMKESGFRSLGQFDWFETELPVPNSVSSHICERLGGERA